MEDHVVATNIDHKGRRLVRAVEPRLAGAWYGHRFTPIALKLVLDFSARFERYPRPFGRPDADSLRMQICVSAPAAVEAQMSRYWISLPDKDLGYLVEGTPEFDDYIADLL